MSYKELKKRIVSRDGVSESSTRAEDEDSEKTPAANGPAQPAAAPAASSVVTAAKLSDSAEFFTFLQSEVDKVNDFFLEKQEDFIIEHQQLSARVAELIGPGSPTRSEVNRLRQQLIDFHAQLVILENYSTVNYTGFRKILKKHDKKTGLNVRSVALNKVSTTPFFLSDIARRLLLSTEQQISQLDQIHKFRRGNSALDLPALPSVHTVPNPTLGMMTLAPLEPAQASQVLPTPANSVATLEGDVDNEDGAKSHPVPETSIETRAPLLRLYRDCVEYARLSKASRGTILPPQSLVDNVDRLDAKALGLTEEFVRSVKEPTNFCLAEDEALSVGYFVLPAGTKLQVFDFETPAAVVVRLVYGTAVLRVFGGSSEVCKETSNTRRRLVVRREGKVVGPWPAFTTSANVNYVECKSIDYCAIVYVQCPPVCNEQLERYAIVRDGEKDEMIATRCENAVKSKAIKVWV